MSQTVHFAQKVLRVDSPHLVVVAWSKHEYNTAVVGSYHVGSQVGASLFAIPQF